jgi:hypothetical protein
MVSPSVNIESPTALAVKPPSEASSTTNTISTTEIHPRQASRVGTDESAIRDLQCRGDTRPCKYNRGPFDIATLAIFPEYIEFDGPEVLRLVVEGAAGRTAT